MMNREAAWSLLCEHTKSESLRKHALAVEACMRAYARRFSEDEEKWGCVGLIHDFDYELYPNAPDHPLKGSEILKARGIQRRSDEPSWGTQTTSACHAIRAWLRRSLRAMNWRDLSPPARWCGQIRLRIWSRNRC